MSRAVTSDVRASSFRRPRLPGRFRRRNEATFGCFEDTHLVVADFLDVARASPALVAGFLCADAGFAASASRVADLAALVGRNAALGFSVDIASARPLRQPRTSVERDQRSRAHQRDPEPPHHRDTLPFSGSPISMGKSTQPDPRADRARVLAWRRHLQAKLHWSLEPPEVRGEGSPCNWAQPARPFTSPVERHGRSHRK